MVQPPAIQSILRVRGAGHHRINLPWVSERSTVLVSVNGPDGPGISAGLMAVLAASEAEIFDVEQIVVRGRLTLNVLISVEGEHNTIGEILYFGWKRGLHIDFEVVDPKPTPIRDMTIVTVLGYRIGPDDFGAVASAIASSRSSRSSPTASGVAIGNSGRVLSR